MVTLTCSNRELAFPDFDCVYRFTVLVLLLLHPHPESKLPLLIDTLFTRV